jgi:calcineurin-like phosphoesterase family protein
MRNWLITDTHFNHPNIITFCKRPPSYKEIIIAKWKRIIRPEDTIFHLGDVIFRNEDELYTILGALPGRKVLIRGNHDYFDLPFYKGEKNSKYKPDFYLKSGFDLVVKSIMLDGNILLSHAPCDLNSEVVMNIHGHFHNNPFENWEEPYRLMYKRDDRYRLLSIENENYYPILLENFVKRG